MLLKNKRPCLRIVYYKSYYVDKCRVLEVDGLKEGQAELLEGK
jgi:hypothetical protein